MTQVRAALYARQSANKQKSKEEQLSECRLLAATCGYADPAEYVDGVSASRYSRKPRTGWPLLLAAIERGEFNLVILWEASRGDRKLTSWSAFLDLCRDRDVKVQVVNDDGRVYDLSIDSDWSALARAGVDSTSESAKMSKRISRGVAGAAKSGNPAQGPTPYGYVRTREWVDGRIVVTQEVDPATSEVAKEIIKRVGKGDPVSAITRDLNTRGITPPGGGSTWYRQRVRDIALSTTYAGKRAHRPGRGTGREGTRAVYDAGWPEIVTEAEHYAAVRTLTAPGRMVTARPGRQVHLLSYLATCGPCGGPVIGQSAGRFYICRAGHVGVKREATDDRVTALVLAYLARDDVYANLAQAGEHADADVLAAREQARVLRGRLSGWRKSAASGQTTPESLAEIEADLTEQIKRADARAERAALPPALRAILEPGADVYARWESTPLAAKRALIAELVTVTVLPCGRNPVAPIETRVIVEPRSRS